MLDGSSSAASAFGSLKDFIIYIMSRFTQYSRFGLLIGGDSTRYAIQHGGSQSIESLTSQMSNINLAGGDRFNLDKSLQQALSVMQDQSSGMRQGVPKMFVILTTSHQKPSGYELEKIKQIQALGNRTEDFLILIAISSFNMLY